MKKRSLWLLVAALFMVVSANMFADIAVKKLSDAEVEVTFTFKMPGYKEVYIAGTMNGWSPTNDLMTKNADDTWTFVLKTSATDSITWKYVADGNWIADLKAPAFTDDGFGGKNGVLDIAAYLAEKAGGAAGAAPVAAGPKMNPINYGTWTILRADAKFLTTDVLSSTEDGFDFDQAFVEAKSYWKLGGDILPNWSVATEMQVLQGSVMLYQSNTMTRDVPFVTLADGLQSLIDAIFHPFDAFNGNTSPLLGHFHATFTSPYAKVHTGYKYAKGTNHAFSWETSSAADKDAGMGFTEVSLGESLQNIADMVKLDVMVAPNKRLGKIGVYSWVNATILNNYVVDMAFNTTTTDSRAFYYFENAKNMFTLGASAKIPAVGLTVKLSGLVNFGTSGGWMVAPTNTTLADTVKQYPLNFTAAALNVDYSSDMFTCGLVGKFGGDSVYMLYSDDDGSLQAGKLFLELTPAAEIDFLSLGLTANVTTSDLVDQPTFTNQDITYYFKPTVSAKLKDLTGIDLTVSALATMNLVDRGASDDIGFKYNEAGLKVNVRKLIDFVPNIELYYTNQVSYGDWVDDTADADTLGDEDVYPDTLMKNSMLFNLGLKGNMSVTGGFIVRTSLTDPVSETVRAFGANLGFSMVTSLLKKPTFYVNGVYNYDPYDDGQPAFDMGDGYYRADDTDLGSGRANFRTGLVWSF